MQTRLDGQALHRVRSARGLTQHQLARLVQVAGGERINRWERGNSEPRARLIPELAQALHVAPFELLDLPNGVDLKALRLAAGRTAPQVAAAVPVSVQSYLNWESGHRRVPVGNDSVLAALGRELGVDRRVLLEALERSASRR